MMSYLLGIDVGTTGTKAMLFTADGKTVAHAYRGYETISDANGRREQNAEDWWNAVCETTREVCASINPSAVVALSLSTQGGTVVPTDRDFRPLAPAMVWSDTRCETERQEFLKKFGKDYLYETTGWGLSNALPLLQCRRLQATDPSLLSRAAWILTVADYLAAKMTGVPAVDYSNAGINQFMNVRKKAYDPALLAFAGLSENQLPRLVPSCEAIGHLTPEAAEALGLTTTTRLVSGAHDQYAVAIGANLTEAGDVLIGSGTSWAITAIGSAPDFSTGLAQSIAAVSGHWGFLTSLSSGGVCLEWLRKSVLTDPNGTSPSYADIDRACLNASAAEDGLFFYPFADRGAFVGLSLSHDRYDMALAVMEGVSFRTVALLDQYFDRSKIRHLTLAGGAAKSPLWSQLLADILGCPVVMPEVPDLACVGAAIMAGVGAGLYSGADEGYRHMSIPTVTVMPDPTRAARYASLREDYRKNTPIAR
ncbi:MAG: hypothetical protein E7618_01995 [Ruminococcaceae bacterium]|nr:hypothetical protein [Oscillospiraceae bacterium]